MSAHHVDVSVQDTSSDEESLWLVFFLLVEVKDFLNTVGAVIGSDLLINVLLLGKSILDFLSNRHLFIAIRLGDAC